jgi:hypothetical protein
MLVPGPTWPGRAFDPVDDESEILEESADLVLNVPLDLVELG